MTEPLLQITFMEFEALGSAVNRLWSRTMSVSSVSLHSRKNFPVHTVLPPVCSDVAETMHSSTIICPGQSFVMVKLDSCASACSTTVTIIYLLQQIKHVLVILTNMMEMYQQYHDLK